MAEINIIRFFDQRHKWVQQNGLDPFKIKVICSVCGKIGQITLTNLQRLMLERPTPNIDFAKPLRKKNTLLKDLPFVKVG